MKKLLSPLLCLLSVCTLTLAQTKNFIDLPYIEVSESKDTLVTPNLIYLKVVISEKDSRDKISLEEQEKKMVASLKGLGISIENDLTTSDIISNYKSYLFRPKEILKLKEYLLKVTTADMASKVIIKFEELGISNISIDQVEHSDIETIKNICRIKAIEKSRIRATSLTKAISQSIGNAIHITDNETNTDNILQGRVNGISIRGSSELYQAQYNAPNIEFEKIKISASVTVKYVLK
ncbi:SIMPL domain-containing protein [Runella limosa]|uniref:SIMPL domain-containing protein n=1 Tax=Runella limosa TaxID=370978 RepID=UPI00042366D4|nr:SIMPL domain-containing protein [Runella limosa]